MFLNELDKQAVRLGSEIMFLEQLVEELRKEIAALRAKVVETEKVKDDNDK